MQDWKSGVGVPVSSIARRPVLFVSRLSPGVYPALSVQLHPRLRAPGDETRQRLEEHARKAVQRVQMQLV